MSKDSDGERDTAMPMSTWEDQADHQELQNVQITPVQQMISSCSGAILTSVFVTPLDVVKIRLQSQSKPLLKGECFLYCNGLMDHLCTCQNGDTPPQSMWYKRKTPVYLNGTLDALIKIPKHEGITSLWSGLPPTLVMAIPATVVYFSCYEYCKKLFGYREDLQSDWWKPMVAGSTARVWAATVISPIEMVRTKMQSEHLSYTEIWKALQSGVQQGGIRSLWHGLASTLWRDVPFSAVYWLGYENIKAKILEVKGHNIPTLSESFVAGGIAGTIAGVITLPFDVIKTHKQIELGKIKSSGNKSTFSLLKDLYLHKGITALFTGTVPRIMKVAPACAIMISSYEYCKNFFRVHNMRTLQHDSL